MDDLDHSIHISEYDWSSFYEESEECVLLQPSLACPDDSDLSDSEDLVLGTGQRDTQQSPDVNSYRDESNHSEKQEKQGGAGAQDDGTQAEFCLKVAHAMIEEDNTEESQDNATNTLPTVDFQSTGESQEGNKNRNVQTESDLEHAKEPDPLSRNQTGLNVNELLATERDVSEAGSNFPRSVEKERWFVTVNENPTRTRERASVKKKRRQKKPCDESSTCSPTLQKPFENDVGVNEEIEEETKTQLNQNFAKTSGALSCIMHQIQVHSDSLQLVEMCNEEENVSEKLLIMDSPEEHVLETKTDRNNHESGNSVPTTQDTVTPSQLERSESDELDDSADFLSTHSYDSESYLSAAESVEEHQAAAEENQLLHSSLCPTSDHRQLLSSDPQMYSCDDVFHSNMAANNYKGHESSSAESSLTFPSAGERAPKMLEDHTTCHNNIHSTTLCMTPDTSAAQSHQKALSVTDGGQLSSSPVPSLTITPCSTADCPETYAQAAGHIRPVYAISAFWDEMEKLTINDILHLKMGRSTPRRGSQESATQSADDSPKSPASLDDAVECSLSDGGLMDTSDTADSDYFTQPDESKPDRSSCEFSTSDFEEEYWQFLDASRNPSPDPGSKTPDINPSFFPHEEECAGSEGKQTPVPADDSAGQWLDHQENHTLTQPAEPRQIMKSKSMRNVHALNTDSLLLPSFDSNEESSDSLNRCQSPDENAVLKVSDSLQTLNSMLYFDKADLLDACHQICFPEVCEDFFKEDKANTAAQWVKVYDPEEISVAPLFNLPLSALSDEMSPSSLGCNKEQPIPIFSSSHPTVRDLAFPKLHFAFFSSNSDGAEDISPMRFMSQPYLQDDQRGSCNWKSFLTIRKINFHDKGSIRCGRSGVWLFPAEEEKILMREEDPTVTVMSEGGVCPASSQLLKEFKEQQRVLEAIQTKQEGMFSRLKQSDMCLVCIAFASWVLKSSDPEAADAWKAALLANVSALSAIRYLRLYVKKKTTNPLQDEF